MVLFNKRFKFSFCLLISIILTFGLSVSLQNLLAAWQAPTAYPPSGNTFPPIFDEYSGTSPSTNSLVNKNLGVAGQLIMSGTGNIVLGNNWLSGDGDNEGISIDSSGNVGIGATNPNAKTQILNPVSTNAFRAGPSNTNSLTIGQSGGDYSCIGYNINFTNTTDQWTYAGADTASLIDFRNGGFMFWGTPTVGSAGSQANLAALMTITSGGNVGIGTNHPAYMLDVAGYVNGAELCINGDCRSSWPAGGGGSSQWSDGTGGIYYDSGRVGISNTLPNAVKLGVGAVAGTSVDQAGYDIGANMIAVNKSLYSYGRMCVGNSSGDCLGTGGTVITSSGINLTTLQATGNLTVGGTANITGATNISSNLTLSGALTAGSINTLGALTAGSITLGGTNRTTWPSTSITVSGEYTASILNTSCPAAGVTTNMGVHKICYLTLNDRALVDNTGTSYVDRNSCAVISASGSWFLTAIYSDGSYSPSYCPSNTSEWVKCAARCLDW